MNRQNWFLKEMEQKKKKYWASRYKTKHFSVICANAYPDHYRGEKWTSVTKCIKMICCCLYLIHQFSLGNILHLSPTM